MVKAIPIGGNVPARLTSQIAAEAHTTVHQVRLAIALSMVARRGGTLAEACKSLGRAKPTVQRIARKWVIDLSDYQPFATRETRPAPIGRLQ